MKAIYNEVTGKFESPKYDALRHSIYYTHKHATERLTTDRGNIHEVAAKQPWQIGDQIGYNAEGWFEDSAILRWTHEAMDLLADKTQEHLSGLWVNYEADLGTSGVAIALEKAAEETRIELVGDLLKKLLRGVESSSNPLTIVKSMRENAAAAKVLERVCGIGSYKMHYAAKDIIEGIDRREAAEAEKRAALVKTIRYQKREACDGGGYYAACVNEDGKVLFIRDLDTKRKEMAKQAANDLATELTATNRNMGAIRVEAN